MHMHIDRRYACGLLLLYNGVSLLQKDWHTSFWWYGPLDPKKIPHPSGLLSLPPTFLESRWRLSMVVLTLPSRLGTWSFHELMCWCGECPPGGFEKFMGSGNWRKKYGFIFWLASLKLTWPWKWMVGILVSFWDGPFSGAMLVSGGVSTYIMRNAHDPIFWRDS